MLDYAVLHLHVSIEGVLCTIESIAASIGTGQFLHNFFVATSLECFFMFLLTSFKSSYGFEKLKHFIVLQLGFRNLFE